MSKQVIIVTSVGRFVWWPFLQVVDWIPKGNRIATVTLQLTLSQNTELGAMIKATDFMLKALKSKRAAIKDELIRKGKYS